MISLRHRLLSSTARDYKFHQCSLHFRKRHKRRGPSLYRILHTNTRWVNIKFPFFVVVLAEQRSLPRPVLKCSRAAVDIL